MRHLVELHGGTVRVQSPGEGRGTTFSVTLPLTLAHPPAYEVDRFHPTTPSASAPDFTTMDLSGIKVLVVDDEPDARDLIRRVLIDCHAEVCVASTAKEALLLVEEERPHIPVSDIGMPEMDGYELLRQMRALGTTQGGRIPAIALTAFARWEDRTRSLRAGFMVHVSKPVEPSELIGWQPFPGGMRRSRTPREALIESRDARCIRCRWMRGVAAQPR